MEKKEGWQHTTSFNYFFLYDKIYLVRKKGEEARCIIAG